VILIALAAVTIASAPQDDVALIRAARAANNAAIAAHDPAAMRTAYADDYIVITGTPGAVLRGGDAVGARMGAGVFRDAAFIAYIRTPDVVTIATSGARAMERGHWIARYTDGVRASGDYLAVWVPVAGGWKLRSESFVTLTGE
jgi:ketosteroid isomerase-like protein